MVGFAKFFTRSLGAALLAIRACALSRYGLPPLETCMQWACFWRQRQSGFPPRTASWGTQWGQFEWSLAATCALLRICGGRLGVAFLAIPLPRYNSGRFGGLPAALFTQRSRRTIVTWLILPVVICLSQRLSHACLSISNYTVKLRMAH